jgi:hypothetical protein
MNETDRDLVFSGNPERKSPVAAQSDRLQESHWRSPWGDEVCLIVDETLGGGGMVNVQIAGCGFWVSSDRVWVCQWAPGGHLEGFKFLEPTPLKLIDARLLTETLETLKKCPLSQRAMTSAIGWSPERSFTGNAS